MPSRASARSSSARSGTWPASSTICSTSPASRAARSALRRARTEVRLVIDRAVDMARPLMDRHEHTLRVDVPATGLPLDGDDDRLVQVVTNLLTNAARYTPRGGHVSLTARAEGAMAEIVCEDDGPGRPLGPSFDALRPVCARAPDARSHARRAGPRPGAGPELHHAARRHDPPRRSLRPGVAAASSSACRSRPRTHGRRRRTIPVAGARSRGAAPRAGRGRQRRCV